MSGDKKTTLQDLSAKIKNIYLQVHGYGFYHNPSEIGRPDERFIGREALIAKLKALFTHNETKSGAYLITGYRGMGKSSLINKAVSEICSNYSGKRFIGRALRVAGVAFLLLLLTKVAMWALDIRPNIWVGVGFLGLVVVSIAIIRIASDRFDNRDLVEGRTFRKFLLNLRDHYWFRKERNPKDRVQAMGMDAILSTVLAFLGVFFWEPDFREWAIPWLLVGVLSFIVYMIWSSVHSSYRPSGKEWNPRNRILAMSVGTLLTATLAFFGVFSGVRCFGAWLYPGLLGFASVYVVYDLWSSLRSSQGHIKKEWDPLNRVMIMGVSAILTLALAFLGVFSGKLHFWDRVVPWLIGLVAVSIVCKECSWMRSSVRRHLGKDWDPKGRVLTMVMDTILSFLLAFVGVFFEESWNGKWVIPGILFVALGYIVTSNWSSLRSSLYRYFNFSQRFYITINLGYDHLKEIDILQLVAKNIKGAYEEINGFLPFCFFNLFWAFINVGFLSLFIGITYLLGKDYWGFWKEMHMPAELCSLFIGLGILLGYSLLLDNLHRFGICTHRHMHDQINRLCEQIDAVITNEESEEIKLQPKFSIFSRGKRKGRHYPIADERCIERELIAFLEKIDSMPRVFGRPQFYFILDELDKIEPRKNIGLSDKETEHEMDDPFGAEVGNFVHSEETRKRQYTVLGILGNMKHFLSTAKAKFIFIAGREIYDAYLADVSDRHYFIGSIFNEVFYVNSFLAGTSDSKREGITSMTETYVCRYLIPPEMKEKECNLAGLRKHLESQIHADDPPEHDFKKVKIDFVISSVENFISYLTYRSNGAPKKITNYFERALRCGLPDNFKEKAFKDDNLVIGEDSKAFYLDLRYFTQYQTGFVSYLAMPFFMTFSKSILEFGDKVIVSTAFLIDHLYKYHDFAFSWRNLELTPEVLDIHKSPELRGLVDNLIRYMSSFHLSEIISGLNDFKFNKRLTEEIRYLSRISEEESAALNFTLDESVAIKRHYNRRLQRIKSSYKESTVSSEYVHSIAFIHMILGDLHYYDEEFDDAIIEYLEALQTLRKWTLNENDESSLYLLLLAIRNMLKLGQAFERKRSYDSAYMIFGQLCSFIVQARDLDLKKISLKPDLSTKPTYRNHSLVKNLPKGRDSEKLRSDYEKALEELGSNYKQALKGAECFMDLLSRLPFTAAKEKLYFKLSLFDGMRLLFQPFMAKFYAIEKASLEGITRTDLVMIENEFQYLIKPRYLKEKSVLVSEFLIKLGNVLYYKNGSFLPVDNKAIGYCALKEQGQCDDCFTLPYSLPENAKHCDESLPGRRTPCNACRQYMKALQSNCIQLLGHPKSNWNLGKCLRKLVCLTLDSEERAKIPKSLNATKSFASGLSFLGDTLVSCSDITQSVSHIFFDAFLHLFKENNEGGEKSKYSKPLSSELSKALFKGSKLELALACYYLSAYFNRRVGDYKEYATQNLKILYLLKDYMTTEKKRGISETDLSIFSKTNLEQIEDHIVNAALRGTLRTYDHIHRMEIERNQQYDIHDLNRCSVSVSAREACLIFERMLIKKNHLTQKEESVATAQTRWKYSLHYHSSFGTCNSMYIRILELSNRLAVNQRVFLDQVVKEQISEKEKLIEVLTKEGRQPRKYFTVGATLEELAKWLIVDSIFCCHEILRSCEVFGVAIICSHSLAGSYHQKMAGWLRRFEDYKKCQNEINQRALEADKNATPSDIQTEVLQKIGKSFIQELSDIYHDEMALRMYRRAEELHSQGKTYRHVMDKMHYLNEDFGDQLTHFCMATERYRINCGLIENAAVKIHDGIRGPEMVGSRLYRYEYWMRPPEDIKKGNEGKVADKNTQVHSIPATSEAKVS